MGTIGVLLLSAEKRIISGEEAIANLDKLRQESFWVSDELFTEIIDKLRDLKI